MQVDTDMQYIQKISVSQFHITSFFCKYLYGSLSIITSSFMLRQSNCFTANTHLCQVLTQFAQENQSFTSRRIPLFMSAITAARLAAHISLYLQDW